jgi:hypothetical protein
LFVSTPIFGGGIGDIDSSTASAGSPAFLLDKNELTKLL